MNDMRPDSLLRLWRYINHLLTYLRKSSPFPTRICCIIQSNFCGTSAVDSLLMTNYIYPTTVLRWQNCFFFGLKKHSFFGKRYLRFFMFQYRKMIGHKITTRKEHPVQYFPWHIVFYKL